MGSLSVNMNQAVSSLLNDCIEADNMLPFYKLTAWKKLRTTVLQMDHNECVFCKRKGRHTRASYVHHVNHVKDKPELALSLWYQDENGKDERQLVSLCHNCHEEAHGHRVKEYKQPLTPERW